MAVEKSVDKKYYINISRQFGSLGRPIAKELSELLGIEYYDRDIVDETAKAMKMPVSKVSEHEEDQKSNRFFDMLFPLGTEGDKVKDDIFEVQQKIILDFASKGSCIFVGRCADYVLRDKKNCLNIHIYAPKQERYLNCVNALKMKPGEAKKMIDQVDKARERYWMKYTKHKPSDPELCHLMINSSIFGVKGTAEILAEIIKKRFGDER